MKTLLLFLSTIIFHLYSKADNPITGNVSVVPNAVETYTVNWDNWTTTHEYYANVYWSVYNGTVISSDKHTVTIQWDDIPTWQNAIASVEVSEDLGGTTGALEVNIVNYILGSSTSCEGILGPSAIFVNFGSGNNPGPALPAGSTTYNYSSTCYFSPGYYTRYNLINLSCNNNWLQLTQDHTPGDINGYMMVIDGEESRGEVFRTTVNGLTQAFGYEFSVFVANLMNPNVSDEPNNSLPRMRFEIQDMSGNLISRSDITEVEYSPLDPWKKVSFLFDLPAGSTSVQIVLFNESGIRVGNDFAVDDISFAPCYPPILASYSNSDIVTKAYTCNNGSNTLYSRWPTSFVPFTNPAYKWQRSSNNGTTWVDIPGANSTSFTQNETVGGIYQYRIYAYESANPSQFVISNAITFFVQKMIVEAKPYNFYNCIPAPAPLNPNYYLQYSDPNGPALNYTFTWSPGTNLSSTTVSNPILSLPQLPEANFWNWQAPSPPPVLYNYTLTVQNTNFTGCSASNTQTVAHYNPRKVVIPTAFTPDNDGTNDLFRPLNIQDYPGGEFWIYNRWGNLVFHSTGPTLLDFSWDGKVNNIPQEIGAYTWQVTIPGCPTYILNGNGTNNPYGTVDLIR